MWHVSASVGDGVANLTRRSLADEVRTAAERSTTNSSCPKYRCSNLKLRLDDVSAGPLTEGRFGGGGGDFWTENSVVNQYLRCVGFQRAYRKIL